MLRGDKSTLKRQKVPHPNICFLLQSWTYQLLLELGHSDVPQPTGNIECGDCYGAKSPNEDGCCNTCDDVRKAYSDMGWMVREDQIAQ